MNATIVDCARALVDGVERRDFAFAIERDRIAALGSAENLRMRFPDAKLRRHSARTAVVPGFINGHSHAYQILMRGWADDLPFARWRSEALYKVVPQLTPDQIYSTFRTAFDEMLAAGITTVAEFFYLNGAGNAHAVEAIRAACDAGIRLVFARTWMDAEYAPAAFRETIDTARERTQALMDEFPQANVCVAPHSLHAASPEMISAAAEFARERDCMLHVHVAEAEYELAQTLERFGYSPIQLLHRLGALDARTVAVHAIYVGDDEKQLIAYSGARIVHNPMTNQYLGDGICDVPRLLELGIPVALGTDADVRPSIVEEMRAASLLQKVHRHDGSALGAQTALKLGTSSGARALNIAAGTFEPGAYADYAVFDLRPMDEWGVLANHLVYRAQDSDVLETYVGGKLVRTRDQAPYPRTALQSLLSSLSL